jgi:hypothetical protein
MNQPLPVAISKQNLQMVPDAQTSRLYIAGRPSLLDDSITSLNGAQSISGVNSFPVQNGSDIAS